MKNIFTIPKERRGKMSNHREGFTLIETLVAIIILSVSIAGPLTLAQRSLSASIYAHDQITAFYLAQEGVEFIRNLRDENNLTPSAFWLAGPAGSGFSSLITSCQSSGCGIDPTADGSSSTPQITACNPSTNKDCLLTFNNVTGVYGYRTGPDWSDSIFTRKIKITLLPVGADELTAYEAVVSVTISWKSGTIDKSFTISEHIFNWRT
jgi:prepilin-type N-terminal cleavage/methylation domain-containing protein